MQTLALPDLAPRLLPADVVKLMNKNSRSRPLLDVLHPSRRGLLRKLISMEDTA